MCYSLCMMALRVQNKDGAGPYADSPQELFRQLNTDTAELPTPEYDIGIERFPYNNEYCGFNSQKQLKNWFDNDELELLESYGYYVVELDVTITAYGERQILFTLN